MPIPGATLTGMTMPNKTPNYGFDLIPDRFRGWGGMYRSMVAFLDTKIKDLTDGLADKVGTTQFSALSGSVDALNESVDALDQDVDSLAGQVASKLSSVATGSGLLGNGTSGSPLRLDPSAIPAPGTSGLTAVAHDGTLTGAGTPGDPLKVNLAILPSGFEVVETSSAAWTVPNDGVLPRFAYLYIQPPAGRWVVPVGFSGLSEGDNASPGLTGKPCIITRMLPDGDTYQTPTDVVKVTWIDFGAAGSSTGGSTTPPTVTAFTPASATTTSGVEGSGEPGTTNPTNGPTYASVYRQQRTNDSGAVDYRHLTLSFSLPASQSVSQVRFLADGVQPSASFAGGSRTSLQALRVGGVDVTGGTRDAYGNLTPNSPFAVTLPTAGFAGAAATRTVTVTVRDLEVAADFVTGSLINPRLELTYVPA